MEFKYIAVLILTLLVVIILIMSVTGAGREKIIELIESIFMRRA